METSERSSLARDWNNAAGLRTGAAVVCGSILTFFATNIFFTAKMTLLLRIGAIAAIAAIGIAGIIALVTPEEDDQPAEKLYTADEVAALLAAVQSGKLVAAEAPVCKYCGGAKPEGTAPDGTRYHRACRQAAYQPAPPGR